LKLGGASSGVLRQHGFPWQCFPEPRLARERVAAAYRGNRRAPRKYHGAIDAIVVIYHRQFAAGNSSSSPRHQPQQRPQQHVHER